MGKKVYMRNGLSIKRSNGWLEGFLKRNNFFVQKAANKPILSDDTLVPRGASFLR